MLFLVFFLGWGWVFGGGRFLWFVLWGFLGVVGFSSFGWVLFGCWVCFFFETELSAPGVWGFWFFFFFFGWVFFFFFVVVGVFCVGFLGGWGGLFGWGRSLGGFFIGLWFCGGCAFCLGGCVFLGVVCWGCLVGLFCVIPWPVRDGCDPVSLPTSW